MIELRDTLRKFVAERDWDQFHSPKNLATALSVEADVLVYLVRLADKLEVDRLAAAAQKIGKNALTYPAARVRGSMKKYCEY